VVTVSDRAVAGLRADASGPVLVEGLRQAGLVCDEAAVVPDDPDAIRSRVLEAVAAGAEVVLTTGGTGIGPRDRTPQTLAPLIEIPVPGLAEGLRATSSAPGAALSRGVAGIVTAHDDQAPGDRRALVVALPGSPSAASDAVAYLTPRLAHAVDQLRGADHERRAGDQHAADHQSPRAASSTTAQRSVSPVRHPGTAPDGTLRCAVVTSAPLDPASFDAAVRDSAAGAVVTFTGVVRDHDGDQRVTGLDYEAHPDAQAHLAALTQAWSADHPAVLAVAVGHRTGALEVGQVAFVASVAAPHRAQAFAAAAALVDLVKARLPVWKHQTFADGTTQWVGSP